MPRFLRSANTQMRQWSVKKLVIGIGLGVCFILLLVGRGGFQQEISRQLSLEQPASDHDITDASKATHSRTISNYSGSSGQTAVVDSNNTLQLAYPDWWKKAWSNSATFAKSHVFVEDRPLFDPPCVEAKLSTHKVYKFMEPRKYLPKSKNPCFWTDPKRKDGLRCVPYFYLAGVAKCGTTDLFGRLRRHPDLLTGTQKEFHWWERWRYEEIHGFPFTKYMEQLTGNELKTVETEMKTKGSSNKIFGDFSPSYLVHNTYWPVLDGNEGCLEPRFIVAQHIRHLYRDAKVILTFRHPTPRLYSRFLSRIPRTSFLKNKGPDDFHQYVLQGVEAYSQCFAKWSVRHCVYNATLHDNVMIRLMEGMYPPFMADWLRVWPRNQLHIMRYEDYAGHEGKRITEIFEFLGLRPLNATEMVKISGNEHVSNSGAREYKSVGAMLPETKAILDKFYQPFINQFAEILNEKRFLWLDTKH